eukprot:UN16749
MDMVEGKLGLHSRDLHWTPAHLFYHRHCLTARHGREG